MRSLRTLSVLNLTALLFHICMAWVSQLNVLSEKNVGEVSDSYPTVFAPAGFTFSIWGVIYISLLAFCVYHLMMAYRKPENHPANAATKRIGWLFIVNSIVTATWLYVWINEMIAVSLILIVVQLITLVLINVRLNIYDPFASVASKILTQFPFSIYFAWICIATIANASAFLKAENWSGASISEINWAIILIGAAALITVGVIFLRRNIFFGLVVIWALYGIWSKRSDIDTQLFGSVINACQAAILVVIISMIIQLIRNLRKSKLPSA